MQYKYVGTHPQDLADGRMLAPGELADLDDEALQDPHNAALVEEGKLIEADEKSSGQKSSGKQKGVSEEDGPSRN